MINFLITNPPDSAIMSDTIHPHSKKYANKNDITTVSTTTPISVQAKLFFHHLIKFDIDSY